MMDSNWQLTEMSVPNERELKKIRLIGCKECGATDVTLIKATDSYYCKFCFNKLKKDKFKKGEK